MTFGSQNLTMSVSSLTRMVMTCVPQNRIVPNEIYWVSGDPNEREYLHAERDRDIRSQLNEQLRLLDQKLEMQVAMISEIQEFYRRRAEVEQEYSRNMDRLVKTIMTKHKAEKQKRDQWPLFSTYTCWQTLLSSTRKLSKDHGLMGEIYGNMMVQRLQDINDDVTMISKRCREIGYESHEKVLQVLNELYSAMKSYHVYHSEAVQADGKLRVVEAEKTKIETESKRGMPKKLKSLEKTIEKRQSKYNEAKLKSLKARNDYLLCIDAANAAVQRYYVDDLSDLMDCMDVGYHNSVSRAMMMHNSIDQNIVKSREAIVELMDKSICDINARNDKQNYIDNNSHVFSLPKKFEFQPHRDDEIVQICAQSSVQDDLLQRYQQLGSRLDSLRLENDETWKTLEEAEKGLIDMINVKDFDMTELFNEERIVMKTQQELQRRKTHRFETEEYYLTKFHTYMIGNNLIARLQAKFSSIQNALGEGQLSQIPRPNLPPKPKKRRIGRTPGGSQCKLFGGNLEDYVEMTGQEIPLVIQSCIRIINLFGLHHQGIFRISGAQVEINEFKGMFEKGDDPLLEVADAKDINSVAGVLKSYFRELQEPLFPPHLFDEFIAVGRCYNVSELESRQEWLDRVKELIQTLPRSIVIVMRYLFAFLSHLSEYSDENMMDPYNLAICFGPTLLPIPADRDQVQFHGSVNDLIKNILMHQEEIFPNDGGPVYDKFITGSDEGDRDTDNMDQLDNLSEDDVEVIFPPSDDVPDWKPKPRTPQADSWIDLILGRLQFPSGLHAGPTVSWNVVETEADAGKEVTASYDFQGRTDREISFKKGDVLTIYSQVSDDWWEGSFQGKDGLIPDKYVKVPHSALSRRREKDRKARTLEDKRRSTESLPMKPKIRLSAGEEMDKSQSQPNIAMLTERKTSSCSIHSTASSASATSEEMDPDTGSMDELEKLDDTSVIIDKKEKTTEDLSLDIDNALAEVMSGLESLEMQQRQDLESSEKKIASTLPKHTPDLVLGLPTSTSSGSSSPSEQRSDPDSPGLSLSAAETFAKSNQSTIKKLKGTTLPRNVGSTITTSPLIKDEGLVKRSISVDDKAKRLSDSSDMSSPVKSDVDRIKPITVPQSRRDKPLPPVPVKDSPVPSLDGKRNSEENLQAPSPGPPPPPKPAKIKPPLMKKPEVPAKSPQLRRKLTKVTENT
ncbi:SLIT-ROBO Rho GTPase-activating protein 1-like isoform X4 [Lineus longissimus]|uniref:SLIT-ROBO Rho GTPase-activating protein 1-like isoform X4 n=1 Tax=Lineus longissimus TaxID=88925 RepID=UPI00315CD8AF